jgi:cytochrome c biogenesis protein CcmG, thiol:disulfide interchange protein DsbE
MAQKNRSRIARLMRGAAALCILLLAAPVSLPASAKLLNRPAPPFARTDLNGSRISLRQYRGKVVLLNFWATWCPPCRVEMPRFMRWQTQYGPQGLQVLAISMDDDASPVRDFLHRLRPNYPVLMGDAQLGERYGGVLGLPVTFLIDRDGVIRARIDGQSDLRVMERKIRALLEAR